MESKIVHNDWAREYVLSRKRDKVRYAEDVELVDKYLESEAKIFEHGAAPFVLSNALSAKDYKVVAGDLKPGRFEGLEELSFDVKKHNSERDKNEKKYDEVIFNELFEHCRLNLIKTFKNVYDSLKKGGHLLLSTPNASSILGIVNLVVRDVSYSCAENTYHEWEKIERIGHMGHVKEDTARDVYRFMKEIGFEPKEIIYRRSYNFSISFLDNIFNLLSNIYPKFSPNFSIICKK